MILKSEGWKSALKDEFQKEYFLKLMNFLKSEREKYEIFPKEDDVFTALNLTDLEKVSVVIIGQDPYHDDMQAHGLAFSVKPDKKIPPSLMNIYKELERDLSCYIPNNGYLLKWSKQGVLLLNTVLTVRAHEANSHKNVGWEIFTKSIIKKLNEEDRPIVFMLWGNPAQNISKYLDNKKHLILKTSHPSPLSSYRGFLGSSHFSIANSYLKENNLKEIDWQIENIKK